MATVQSYTKAGVDAKFAARSANVLPHNGGGTPDIAAFPDAKTGDVIERSSDGARWRVLAGVLNPIEGRAVSVNGKTGAVTLNASDVGAAPTNHKHVLADVTDFKGDVKATANTYALRNGTGQLEVAEPTQNTHAVTKKYVDDTAVSNATWNAIQNKPATFPPSAHKHTIADITDLTVARNADVNTVPVRGDDGTIRAADPKDKADVATKKYVDETSGSNATWAAIQGKPDTFPPSAHTHVLKDITNMPEVTEQNVFNSVVKRTAAGRIKISSPAEFNEATTKQYVDDLVVRNRLKTSNTWTVGDADAVPMRDADGQFEVGDPTADNHVATKKYVDTKSASAESIAWDKVTDKPSTYYPSAHTHQLKDISDLSFDYGMGQASDSLVNRFHRFGPEGRLYAPTPVKPTEVSNKDYVDSKEWDSFKNFPGTDDGSSENLAGQRGKLVTYQASSGRLVVRYTPSLPIHVANKLYVDQAISAITVGWTNIADKPSTFPPSVHKHTIADITDLTVSNSATAGTVPLRDTSGRMKSVDPSATNDVATKSYVDNKYISMDQLFLVTSDGNTPNRIIKTDNNNRFKIVEPVEENNPTTKKYVDINTPAVMTVTEYSNATKVSGKIYIVVG